MKNFTLNHFNKNALHKNNMIVIKIFSSYGNDKNITDLYIKRDNLLNDSDYNSKYKFTDNNDYTHVIIINTAKPDIRHIPKKNIIGISHEPLEFLYLFENFKNKNFLNYAKKYIGKYYIGNKKDLPYPFINKYSYLFSIIPLNYKPVKSKVMSIIISEKKWCKGHNYRHILVNEILKRNLPVDIFGSGCKFYNNDSRIKGPFKETEPYLDYKFHIAIENFQTPQYFSEKIINPLLTNTIPIYLGCKNIDNYFNDNLIHLSGLVEKDIILITNICNNPENYKKKIDIENVKNVISIKNLIKEFY